MIKKLPLLFLVLFLFQIEFAFSQTNTNNLIDSFVATMENAGLSKSQITKVKDLLIERDRIIAEDAKQQNELKAKYPVPFRDDEITEEYNNKQFILSLSKLITIEQFGRIFFPQLEYRIDRITAEKWQLAKEKYTLTKEQEKKYRNLLYENTKKEIFVREYYSYDKDLSWNTYTEEKIKSSNKEFDLIKSFGQLYSKNSKTDALIKKLTDAKIDTERINQILLALQIFQERNDKRLKTWRENDGANIFNFHDPGDDEYAIYLEFREKLSKTLKIEEFKTVFVSQMQNRINRDSEKEFQTLKSAYKLTDQQYDEIQKLVLEKNTEKIVTEEYYKYSYELYQQKLRAVEYRHEKGIRETIQKFNSLKS
ncbi:hypothetical protein [Flavobacterium salmonis]|uniref:Uncharacterized protein n=1 Tax=Flavobacterium salmonis TaxID=2654844 RepID=A0A6V6ZEL5_9FLAO|nr:hypothetical protein [Flavobacterium salmonis]CAD0009332.1 hypothetical protein FLAT13_04851 [Flavobacterium salmonis]